MFIEMGSHLEAPEDPLDHITRFKIGKCKGWHTFQISCWRSLNGCHCSFKRRAARVWQKPWLQSLETPTQHKGGDQHKKALIGPASFAEMF